LCEGHKIIFVSISNSGVTDYESLQQQVTFFSDRQLLFSDGVDYGCLKVKIFVC